jgi:hypothetical protein
MEDRHVEIEKRAYLFWMAEGRPQGKELEHWLRAEAEVDARGNSEAAGSAGASAPRASARPRAQRRRPAPR